MKRCSALLVGIFIFSGCAFAGGFKFNQEGLDDGGGSMSTPPTKLVGDSVDTNRVYTSGSEYNGRPTYFYRKRGGDGYSIMGLPISTSEFNKWADKKISIWEHIQNCDTGTYKFVSPATLESCSYTVSATCQTSISCESGGKWECGFTLGVPEELVELLKKDKSENLGVECITPYEQILYNSTNCKLAS